MEIKLTAKQIAYFDEIALDKEAEKKTLDMALTRHANRTHELIKEERAFWRELAEIHGLDLNEKAYKITRIHGAVAIVEAEDDRP